MAKKVTKKAEVKLDMKTVLDTLTEDQQKILFELVGRALLKWNRRYTTQEEVKLCADLTEDQIPYIKSAISTCARIDLCGFIDGNKDIEVKAVEG